MTKKKLAIIDADGFLFYAAWQYRKQCTMFGMRGAKSRLDKILTNVFEKLGISHYIGFFGEHGYDNFRYDWATLKPYKGTRHSDEWQKYFKPGLKKHFTDRWNFIGVKGIEADDAVIIAYHQFKDEYDIIMVGEDKDMKQLGEFTRYNPRTKKIDHITKDEGRKFFWSQMLMGDSSDNIAGVEGIGKDNIAITELQDMNNPSEEEMFNFVASKYVNKYKEDYMYYMVENYVLLKMLDEPAFDYPETVEPVVWKEVKQFKPKQLINL